MRFDSYSETFTLPAHWAPALINGDETGLMDDEQEQLMAFLSNEGFPQFHDCTDEPGFVTYHEARPYGVLACDCLEFTATCYIRPTESDVCSL